jgi:hypothetical protein
MHKEHNTRVANYRPVTKVFCGKMKIEYIIGKKIAQLLGNKTEYNTLVMGEIKIIYKILAETPEDTI